MELPLSVSESPNEYMPEKVQFVAVYARENDIRPFSSKTPHRMPAQLFFILYFIVLTFLDRS